MNDIVEPATGDESIWKRLLFMLLYAFLYGISDIILFTVALIQFGFVAITGERNSNLLQFSAGLTRFIYQVVRFLTFNSDTKPFPFSPWPTDEENA